VVFEIEHTRESLRCFEVRALEVILRGTAYRRFSTLPIGKKATLAGVGGAEVEVRECGSSGSGRDLRG